MTIPHNTVKHFPASFYEAVDLGWIDGWSIFRRFGRNPAIATNTDPEDVWATGGTRVEPSSATVISIASDNIADDGDPEGTGAHIVEVLYLDENYDQRTENVTLNGTTTVTTTGTAIRFIRAYVLSAGSGNANAGIITFTIDSQTQGTIQAGDNQTLITHYTVPAGFTAHLMHYTFTQSGGASNSDFRFYQRPDGGVWRVMDSQGLEATGSSSFTNQLVHGVSLPAKTDLKMVVESVTQTIAAAGTYELLLEPTDQG